MKDFPPIRSLKSAVIGTLAVSIPLLALSSSPLTGVYTVMLVFFLLPTALCLTAAVCGMLPMAVNALAALFSLYRLAGSVGMMLGALYIVPLSAAFLLLIRFRVPFWKACGGMILTHLVTLAGALAILQGLTGGDVYQAAGDRVREWLENWELGDFMLYQFYEMGVIGLPESLTEQAVGMSLGDAMSGAVRQDLLLSAQALVENTLRSVVAPAIIQQSVLGGVACLLVPIRFGCISAEIRSFRNPDGAEKESFPDLGMPALDKWHIPRGIGWKVGLAYVGGTLLSSLSSSVPPAMAGMILYSAAWAVFAVQGAALMNHMQKTKGTKRFWRVAVPILLLVLGILPYLGIFDQIVNIRGLRVPPESKEDNEP